MANRRSFSSRFPTVAKLFSGTSLSTDPDEDEDEDEEEEEEQPAARSRGARPSAAAANQDKIQRAFDRDADALISAEKDRWNDVLASDEGKANVAGARNLLFKTSMDADAVIETLADMADGKEAAAPKNDKDARREAARERLAANDGVDRDTGGAGAGKERGSLESARERRKRMSDERNEAATKRAGLK